MFFRELGFTSLLKRIAENSVKPERKAETMAMNFAKADFGKAPALYWAEFGGRIYLTDESGKAGLFDGNKIPDAKIHRAYDAKKIMNLVSDRPDFADDLQIMFWLLNPNRSAPEISDALSLIFPEESIRVPESLKLLPGAYEILLKDIKEKNILSVYQEIEIPLIPVLSEMEKNGIACDVKILQNSSEKIRAQISKLEKLIYKDAGQNFNINSTRELSRILFEKLKVSVRGLRKTSGGKISTQFSELLKLRAAHSIIPKIIEYRELAKISSTYVDSLPKQIQKDGRIHTTYLQTGTVTGRLSSANPNLQNVPIKSELGDAIRSSFYAPRGKLFLAFDYSQMQLRIAAYLSGDEKLLEFFKEGKDVHRSVAAEVFGVPESEVTPEMRRRAKTINFGILYGMGANALSENLGVSRDEAAIFLEDYFLRFSGLARYFEDLKEKAATQGYVETIFGRRRYLPEINSGLAVVQREAERMAVNTPIQGSEADIMKLAMIRSSEKISSDPKLKGKIKMILQIHDELLFEVEKSILDYGAKTLKPIMENIISDKIFLPVDVKSGSNWALLEKHD